ncbi:extracellular solute-binding protein [Treponema sp. OMZ 840]|uniref:extracellular solute-binding protein n=1 Tax=Treponema sp. OMZ 840 TaxID=244313 RepID=UPI003D91755F
MRKNLKTIMLIMTACLPVLLFSGGKKDTEEKGMVISYNSPAQWANWGAVLEAFTAKTGIAAPSDPKNSGQSMAALEAERKAPQADTAYFGIVFGLEAAKKDLLEPWKPEYFDEIPDNLKAADGSWYTLHQGAIAFIVNTAELKGLPIPKSWKDLLKPIYKGKVGFLDPTQAAVGFSVYTAGNLAMGGTLTNWTPGVEYFKQLYKNGLNLPAQTATAMVQQGEVPILIDADFNGYKLKYIDNAPVDVVIPEEGSISIPYVISLVKGAPNRENGQALINFSLSDEGQRLFTESYLRPVRNIKIAPEIASKILPASDYKRVSDPDFAKMRAAQDEATKRWRAEVIR